jgi:GH35 family endo-1,4-beta-xylanase
MRFLLSLLCFTRVITAQDLPGGGRELLDAASWQAFAPAAFGKVEKAEGPGWRVTVSEAPPNPWDAQTGAALKGEIKKGDCVLLAFRARALPGPDGVPAAQGTANIECKEPPLYPKAGMSDFQTGSDWKWIYVPFVSGMDVPSGKGGVAIHLGGQRQVIEIAGLTVRDYGPDFDPGKLPRNEFTYGGREPEAPWRAEALARIEKLRKATLTVKVTDAAGAPVKDVPVQAVLTRSRFGFGSAIAAGQFMEQTGDGEKYRRIVDECFSKVVLENDLKMGGWEQSQKREAGNYFNAENTDKVLAWCRERGIAVRGHYLMWAPWEPWSEKLKQEPDKIRARILSHLAEKVPVVGNRVCEWDAINHLSGWAENVNAATGNGIYADVMRTARGLTRLPLWVNEDQVFRPGRQQEDYFALIKELIGAGAGPDGIGNMAHFHFSYLPPVAEMLRISDRFAALVPRLQITEYDLVSGGDGALEADHLRDMLLMAYSHPAYEGFLSWGFWEGNHWKPEAAWWRKDWSGKPSAKVWREWVCGKWRTRETGRTDAAGAWTVRGHHGRYEITVTRGGVEERQTAELAPGGSTVTVRLR